MKYGIFSIFILSLTISVSAQDLQIKWSGKDACGHSYLYTEVSGPDQPSQIWWTAEYLGEGKVSDTWHSVPKVGMWFFETNYTYFFSNSEDSLGLYETEEMPLLAHLAKYTAFVAVDGDTLSQSYIVSWDELPENGNSPAVIARKEFNFMTSAVINEQGVNLTPANWRHPNADQNPLIESVSFSVDGVEGGYTIFQGGAHSVVTTTTLKNGLTCVSSQDVNLVERIDTLRNNPTAVDTTVQRVNGNMTEGIKLQMLVPASYFQMSDFYFIPEGEIDTLYPEFLYAGHMWAAVENLGYGTYGAYVTDMVGSDDMLEWKLEKTSAIQTIVPSLEIAVFPNPTVDYFQVTGTEYESGAVYDLAGRLVASFQPGNTVDIAHLTAGTYVVQVTNRDGRIGVSTFVKTE